MTNPYSYQQYIGGTDADDIDRAFYSIVNSLITNDAQFLFGAGMSKESEVPIGYELAVELLNIFFPGTGTNPPTPQRLGELASEFPFEAITEALERNLGNTRDDLTEELTKILIEPQFQISQAHKDFLSICYWWGTQIPNQIFTTNFDKLLEKSIGLQKALTIEEDNAHGIKKAQQKGLLPVIHLHGILDGKYQVTETDVYDTRFSALFNEFESALYNCKAFVFVGYSMMDPDLRRIYMEYREGWKLRKANSDKKTYFISPPKDEFSYRLGKKIHENRGSEWIPLSAAEFFARLKDLMDTHTETEARKMIMNKYHTKDENAIEDLIEAARKTIGGTRRDGIMLLLQTRAPMGVAK